MEPYENQLIGAFLYVFGYTAAKRDSAQGDTGRVMPVNLLQQTPLDTTFGDLVVGSDRCLVIEFKRSEKELASESKKWSTTNRQAFLSDSEMLKVSARTHMVVYGAHRGETLDMRSCYYLDVLGAFKEPSLDRRSGQELIAVLLNTFESKSARFGASSLELKRYLKYLASVRKKQSSQGGQKVASGHWVGVAEKNGQLMLHTADSLEALLELEHSRRYQRDRKLDLENGHEIDRELDRDHYRGFGR